MPENCPRPDTPIPALSLADGADRHQTYSTKDGLMIALRATFVARLRGPDSFLRSSEPLSPHRSDPSRRARSARGAEGSLRIDARPGTVIPGVSGWA